MKITTLATIALMFVAPALSSGTALYPVYWKGALFVGQDTLEVVPQLKKSDHRCKMFVNDQFVLGTAAALALYRRTGGKGSQTGHMEYKLDPRLNEIFKTHKDSGQMVKQIIAAAEEWEKETMTPMIDSDRARFAAQGFKGFLFWFENGVTMNQFFAVYPVLNGRAISFNVDNRQGKKQIPAGHFAIPEGISQRAWGFPGRPERMNAIDDGVGKVEWLLQKESELSKDVVGTPFTIFRLSPIGGSNWMKGAEQCKANTHLTATH
jgi:hypothetical protein